jgi:hypothetical protein
MDNPEPQPTHLGGKWVNGLHCSRFSLGTLVSSTIKIDRPDMTEILLKMALNTTTVTLNILMLVFCIPSFGFLLIKKIILRSYEHIFWWKCSPCTWINIYSMQCIFMTFFKYESISLWQINYKISTGWIHDNIMQRWWMKSVNKHQVLGMAPPEDSNYNW